jgi:Fe-S cluster biosynthesis and repair protein YggX
MNKTHIIFKQLTTEDKISRTTIIQYKEKQYITYRETKIIIIAIYHVRKYVSQETTKFFKLFERKKQK